jgi:hypothetical protein
MLIAIVPLVVCVVGLLIWALSQNAVLKDVGRIMFTAGLFVSLLVLGSARIHIP